jgi:threonylcarbamoyladenosine tRNA methylthiotransferase MtaB
MKTLAQHERYIGRTMSVLFEQGERDGFRLGLTENFMRVGVASQDDLAGALRDVTITGATEGMALGRLVPASHHPSTVPLL